MKNSVLPRHTKVIVTGNNRTKSVFVGLQGVVKKAVGLGGWHWQVLKKGVEVKLQRNALTVLKAPTGNEEDDDEMDCDNSLCSSSDMGDKVGDYRGLKICSASKLDEEEAVQLCEDRKNFIKQGEPTADVS